MAAPTFNTPPAGVNAPAHPPAERRAAALPVGDAPTRRSSRRRFLAEAGATIAASLGVTAVMLSRDPSWGNPVECHGGVTHLDATLLAACAEVIALQDRIDALWAERAGDEDAIDAAVAPIEAEQEEPLERVCALRATTLAGHQARVRALLAWDKDPPTADDGCWNDAMVGALLRDLTQVSA